MQPKHNSPYYTLYTTEGEKAVIAVKPEEDPWLVAVRYVRERLASDAYLADLLPATPQEIAAFRAENSYARAK